MQDGFVMLMSFSEPLNANLAKGRLESEGITCYLSNENTIRTDIFWTQALGGVQLFVLNEDAARARAILEPIEQPRRPRKAAPAHLKVTSAPNEKCPECGSDNVYDERRPTMITTILFYLGIPFFSFRHKHRCADCGREWKPQEKGD